jgi:hypothetical protein
MTLGGLGCRRSSLGLERRRRRYQQDLACEQRSHDRRSERSRGEDDVRHPLAIGGGGENDSDFVPEDENTANGVDSPQGTVDEGEDGGETSPESTDEDSNEEETNDAEFEQPSIQILEGEYSNDPEVTLELGAAGCSNMVLLSSTRMWDDELAAEKLRSTKEQICVPKAKFYLADEDGSTPDGKYYVWVQFLDDAGKRSPVTMASTILDTTPPTAPQLGQSQVTSKELTFGVMFWKVSEDENPVDYLVSIDGGAWVVGEQTECDGVPTMIIELDEPGEPDGHFEARILARDAAGNDATDGTQPLVQVVQLKLDRTAPQFVKPDIDMFFKPNGGFGYGVSYWGHPSGKNEFCTLHWGNASTSEHKKVLSSSKDSFIDISERSTVVYDITCKDEVGNKWSLGTRTFKTGWRLSQELEGDIVLDSDDGNPVWVAHTFVYGGSLTLQSGTVLKGVQNPVGYSYDGGEIHVGNDLRLNGTRSKRVLLDDVTIFVNKEANGEYLDVHEDFLDAGLYAGDLELTHARVYKGIVVAGFGDGSTGDKCLIQKSSFTDAYLQVNKGPAGNKQLNWVADPSRLTCVASPQNTSGIPSSMRLGRRAPRHPIRSVCFPPDPIGPAAELLQSCQARRSCFGAVCALDIGP